MVLCMAEERFPFRRVDLSALRPCGSLELSYFFMFGSYRRTLPRHLSCSRTHSTDAHKVVGQAGQAHEVFVAPGASQLRLAQAAYRLAPAKELFDAFAHDLTGPVSGGLQGAFAQPRGEVRGIEGDVRGDALREQAFDEPARVIALVAADTFGSQFLAPLAGHERQCRFGLRHADRLREAHVSDQAVPIVHQRMSGKTQLGFFAQRLAQQLRLRVRGTRVRVVATPLALEVPVSTSVGSRATAILGPERLHRGPSLDQGAIDTE